MSYQERDETLRRLGFSSYKKYLESDLWISLRGRVLTENSARCTLCPKEATQVHHTSYGEPTLGGESLEHLFPICGGCHLKVEFSKKGEKRNFGNTQQVFNLLKERRENVLIYEAAGKPVILGRCRVCGNEIKKRKGKNPQKYCLPCRRIHGPKGKPWIGLAHKAKHIARRRGK